MRFGVATKAYIFKDNKILIIYKTVVEAANDPDPNNRKDVPGGRVEFGEAPIQALYREIGEESGLKVKVIRPIRVWHFLKESFQLVGINFLCLWEDGEVSLSEEHESYQWLTKEALMAKNWHDLEQYLEAFEAYEKEMVQL